MKKKKVYFYQFHAPSSKNLLPLAAGLIVSYAKSIPKISDNYDLEIKVLREDPIKMVNSQDNPDVLGFSVYSWNFQQSLRVAQLSKEKHPGVLVVFGGPMIGLSIREDELEVFFSKYPFVDMVVHGMGEWTFADMLVARLEQKNWESIAGISYRNSKSKLGFTSTGSAIFKKDLDQLPSPFLDGTFDEILDKYGNDITGALWETNRGCPFRCTFCVQGDDAFNNVLVFNTERLNDELEWMSRRKIEYIFATDANFGIKRRDIQIAEKVANLKIETGYPKFLMVNWLKNSSKKVLDTADVLSTGNIYSRMTLSRQSFNDDTLEAVKRKNIKLSAYDEMKQEATKKNVASYTELILGLPGETYESFIKGIVMSMDKYPNHVFVIYLCRLLAGTEMSTTADRKKYQYQTRTCNVGFGRYKSIENGVDELEEIIIGTSTMPIPQWRQAHVFANMTLALYNFRLAFYILNYLKHNYEISYSDFFEYLIKEVPKDSKKFSILNQAIRSISDCQQSILDETSSLVSLPFTKSLLFEPNESATLILLNEVDTFYNELWILVNKYLTTKDIIVDEAVLKEIFKYQVALIPTWKKSSQSNVLFEMNIPQYFHALCSGDNDILIKKQISIMELEDELDYTDDPVEFSQKRLTIATFRSQSVKSFSTKMETYHSHNSESSIYENLDLI